MGPFSVVNIIPFIFHTNIPRIYPVYYVITAYTANTRFTLEIGTLVRQWTKSKPIATVAEASTNNYYYYYLTFITAINI